MRIRNRIFLSILLVASLISCLNSYEKEVVGEYIAKDFQFIKENFISDDRLPKLILRDDLTYSIIDDHKKLSGTWKADDNGDMAYIVLYRGRRFSINGEKIAEGRISGGDEVIIDWFHCYSGDILTNYKVLSFIKK